MNEQELARLRSEIIDAHHDLNTALSNASDAIENLQEFYESYGDPSDEFEYLINKGFVPGAIFNVDTMPDSPLKVVSYAYHTGRQSEAGVVFEYTKNGEVKRTQTYLTSIKKYLEKFVEVKK